MPLVSIGMPVYNGERFLEKAIDSILGQTHTELELIISDNASTDRTEEICRAYAARDNRVKYSRNEKNLGAAENYNRVFRVSSGRYFKWAAHDDVCAPEFVERCVEVLDSDASVVLCYPRSDFIDATGRRLEVHHEEFDYPHPRPHQRLRTWLMDQSGGWCNLVFGLMRSSVLRETALIGKYDSSDYNLVGELALLGKIRRLPQPLFFRRDHPGRSALANPGAVKSTLWFDSSAKTEGVYFPRWRWLSEYVKAVFRLRIGFLDTLCALGVILRWAIRVREDLKTDLVVAARTVVRRYRPNAGSTG